MKASVSPARIFQGDIEQLDIASNKLTAVAEMIRRYRPAWGEIAVTQLLEVQNVVERLKVKGAKAYAKFYERHGAPAPQDESSEGGPGETSSADVPAPQDEEEP